MLPAFVCCVVALTKPQARSEHLLAPQSELQAKHEALQAKHEALQAKYVEALRIGRDAEDASAPGRGLFPSLIKHLRHFAHGECGPNKDFALYPHEISRPLLAELLHDVVQPDGCNVCHEGEHPVWAAPGDLCDMLEMGLMEHTRMPRLRHCATPEYREDYNPAHHVKTCLPDACLNYLWSTDPPHCIEDGKPILAKEGLLFCIKGRRRSQPPSPSPPPPSPKPSPPPSPPPPSPPSSPSADRRAYDSCLVDLDEARKEYKECAAKAAQVFTPKTKKELEDAVNEWCRNPGQSCSKFGDISEWDVSMGCDAMFGRRSEHVDASVGCLMQRSANRCKRQRASATSQERSCREVQKCLCAELALALARNRSG